MKSKCTVCGRFIDEQEIIRVNNKKYCSICGEPVLKKANEYKELMEYIYNLCNKDQAVMGLVSKQIKDFVEKNEYTYTGILFTLKYVFELREEKLEFRPEMGLAFVPYYYVEARNFHKQVYQLDLTPEEEIERALEESRKFITIELKRSDLNAEEEKFWDEQRKKMGREMLDMDDIEEDED